MSDDPRPCAEARPDPGERADLDDLLDPALEDRADRAFVAIGGGLREAPLAVQLRHSGRGAVAARPRGIAPDRVLQAADVRGFGMHRVDIGHRTQQPLAEGDGVGGDRQMLKIIVVARAKSVKVFSVPATIRWRRWASWVTLAPSGWRSTLFPVVHSPARKSVVS